MLKKHLTKHNYMHSKQLTPITYSKQTHANHPTIPIMNSLSSEMCSVRLKTHQIHFRPGPHTRPSGGAYDAPPDT